MRGRPIVLLGKDGHAFWCSEKAIALSGPFPDTIEGGVIVRDDKGLPAGYNNAIGPLLPLTLS